MKTKIAIIASGLIAALSAPIAAETTVAAPAVAAAISAFSIDQRVDQFGFVHTFVHRDVLPSFI